MDLTDSPPAPARPTGRATRRHPDLATIVIGAALATVVATTGFVSYTHISALTMELHQSWKTAHLTPVFIDGQIVIGSVFYMVVGGKGRWWGMLGVVPGLAESLFANWESGITGGYRAAIWATVAAQAFAVSSYLFERWLKAQASPQQPGATVSAVTVGCGHGLAGDRDSRILDGYLHLRDCLGADPSYRGIGTAFSVHHDTVRQLVIAADGDDDSQPAGAVQGPAPAELNGASA